MTEDRAALGARLAELMGWEHDADADCWIVPEGVDDIEDWVEADALVTWWGYGIVDQYMREQGCTKRVVSSAESTTVSYRLGKVFEVSNSNGDEPLAACQAAKQALEARDE